MTGQIAVETDIRHRRNRRVRAAACRSGRKRRGKRNAAASSPLIMLLTVLLCAAALLYPVRLYPAKGAGGGRRLAQVLQRRQRAAGRHALEHSQ